MNALFTDREGDLWVGSTEAAGEVEADAIYHLHETTGTDAATNVMSVLEDDKGSLGWGRGVEGWTD